MIDAQRVATPYHLIPALLAPAPLTPPLNHLRVRQRPRTLLSHRPLARPRVFEPRVLAEVLLLRGFFELDGQLVEGDDVGVGGGEGGWAWV